MLHYVATMISSLLAVGTLTLIVSFLARDWRTIVWALRNDHQFHPMPLPIGARITLHDRRPRVISVRSQSVPRRAAA